MSSPYLKHILPFVLIIRPQQWVKNLFVFLPMFFGGMMTDGDCWQSAAWTFISFSLMASAVYCFNDVRDAEADRIHPSKRKRQVAAGNLSPMQALALMVILVLLSLAIATQLLPRRWMMVGAVMAGYFVLNIAYSVGLKRIAIVDVMIIAIGFVMRVVAGGLACGIPLSPWIVVMTFLLTLFLAFAKRREDVVIRLDTGVVTRRSTLSYTLPFLNQVLGLLAAVTLVGYILYTLSSEVVMRVGSPYVYITSIWVLAGMLRYMQTVIADNHGGNPERDLLRDPFLMTCVAGWLTTFAILLYA